LFEGNESRRFFQGQRNNDGVFQKPQKKMVARLLSCALRLGNALVGRLCRKRAGIKCVVLLPESKIAFGKLSQAVYARRGNFDEALNLVKELRSKCPIALLVQSILSE
jgi:hypothetical protein